MSKRITVSLIPYRKNAGGVNEFFLQMRDEKAPTYANHFGLFGGGVDESEDLEPCMRREIREELKYESRNPRFIDFFEDADRLIHFYIEEVGANFESLITVQEGKYGKFLTALEIRSSDIVASHVAPIIRRVENVLA